MAKLKKLKKKTNSNYKKIKAIFSGEHVFSNSAAANNLHAKSRFGEVVGDKVQYSLVETCYLLDEGSMEVFKKSKKLIADKFSELACEIEQNFMIRYAVFADLRNKGYVVKTALKFGADFMVYDKGKKPGEAHARWIIFPVYESSSLTWQDFAAKNRVAHSTKKNLLIAIVDDSGDVIYYNVSWLMP